MAGGDAQVYGRPSEALGRQPTFPLLARPHSSPSSSSRAEPAWSTAAKPHGCVINPTYSIQKQTGGQALHAVCAGHTCAIAFEWTVHNASG